MSGFFQKGQVRGWAVLACALFVAAGNARAGNRFVATNGNDAASGTNWATAKLTIQAGIDAAAGWGTVWVSNGVYATGGRAVFGAMTNRVAIGTYVKVRSINGPAATTIQGAGDPTGTNGFGNAAVRCAYVGTNALLEGFTLIAGRTRASGDYDREKCGGGAWCEDSGEVSNCVLIGNSAYAQGGGASDGILNNCQILSNSAVMGGGACNGELNRCIVAGNSATQGGGTAFGWLRNCAVTGNSAVDGGGVYGSGLYNCTLTGNSATHGGGSYGSALANCIAYYNKAQCGVNYVASNLGGFSNTCTTPMPIGTGNITNEPALANFSHLAMDSPCIGAGSHAVASGTDIDGQAWASHPSMGCDEVRAGSITGDLSVAIQAAYTQVAVGFPVEFQAEISGRPTANAWHWGDGTVSSNRPYAAHAFAEAGTYEVTLMACNESDPSGVAATATVQVAEQMVHYVDIGNAAPAAPFSSWATAATNIQDAIDSVSQVGALILVSDGVYATGGRAVHGTMTNRVVLDKPVTVRSVNGPESTIIQGAWAPEPYLEGYGEGAVRCAYVGTHAVLSGFTLTNGATRGGGGETGYNGGGAWCEVSGVLSNCTLTGNVAGHFGGGSYGGTLDHCALSGNRAVYGGGGSYYGRLNHCTLAGNDGGHCGGGVRDSVLHGCALVGNSAESGGGSYSSQLIHCTLTGNSGGTGGGSYDDVLNNCIVYFNTGEPANQFGSMFHSSCTTPTPEKGAGNVTNGPVLASAWRIAAGSPCIGAGSTAYACGTDIDGEAWLSPPALGCDEVRAGSSTGALSVGAWAAYTNVVRGYSVRFRADISGRTTGSVWQWGDGSFSSNEPYAVHAFPSGGVFNVVMTAYNESHPLGVATMLTVHVAAETVHYVGISNTAPASPYASWATAATNIQDAIDVASVGALVLVSNGTYGAGGRVAVGETTNRIAIDKAITVRSFRGSSKTLLRGSWDPATSNGIGAAAVRCAYVGSNAALVGFTLTQGATRSDENGGGAWCETSGVLSNCLVTGNSASGRGGGAVQGRLFSCTLSRNSAGAGGGSYGGRLSNCLLDGNSAAAGGGSCGGTLVNCTVVGNVADCGGGSDNDMLYNSIVYFNAAPNGTNHFESHGFSSCSSPALSGNGNMTNNPLFLGAAGNYRLSASSPCIDRGNGDYVDAATDLDFHPRILSGCVDLGAYEYQPQTWYVATNGSDSAVGTSWSKAKQTIQAAVDAATVHDTVWVGDGVYDTGGATIGEAAIRVSIDKAITVQSAHGPASTVIQGAWDPGSIHGIGDAAVRCVRLTGNAVLIGFTLTKGATPDFMYNGGGVWSDGSGVVSNCIIIGNSAGAGGGSYRGTLNQCLIAGNYAVDRAGGSYGSWLNDCTLAGNTAASSQGGGTYMCTGYNCIVYFNLASTYSNAWCSQFYYSCISADPQFVDAASGNYRLRTNSPCINRGGRYLLHALPETDLDGNPRIAYSAVDMGAYEAQFPVGYWAWAAAITNGLTNDTDCAAADGMPNLLKYATGSSPTEADGLAQLGLAFGNGAPTLLFNRNPDATDVTLEIQGADEMSDEAEWRGLATNVNGSWGGATNVNESGQENPVVCTVQDSIPLFTNRFLRLKVTRP